MKLLRFMGKLSFAVLLSIFVATPGVGATTFAGIDGKIAYTKTAGGTSTIWQVNANGRHNRQLTQKGTRSPVWSPDGRRLVYSSTKGELYITDQSGWWRKQLTNTHERESSPIWSPDGTQIAFVREKHDKRTAVFVMRLNGSGERNVSGWRASGGYRSPSWAPDSQQLVYEQFGDSSRKLYIGNLKNSQATELTTISDDIATNVSWSPSGKKILFSDSLYEVYTIWPDGSHRTVISDGDSAGAAWSPSGSQIAFLEDDTISISEVDGTIRQLVVQKGNYQTIDHLVWSPDGTKLLFTMTKSDQQRDIFTLNLKDEAALPVKVASGNLSQPNWQAR